jgi:hypothetical protein
MMLCGCMARHLPARFRPQVYQGLLLYGIIFSDNALLIYP